MGSARPFGLWRINDGTKIDGKAIAAALRGRIGAAVQDLQNAWQDAGAGRGAGREDAASQVYVKNKGIATKEAGMTSLEFRLPEDTPEEVLLGKVRELNADPAVNGILVQFPVPAQISQQVVIDTIDAAKDVDGLNPANAGRLVSGLDALTPCTPLAVSFSPKKH